MIGDLLAILGLCFFCYLFWQQRRQAELAKAAITRKCEQLDLQLISIAFGAHKLKTQTESGVGIRCINLSFHLLVTIATKES